MLVKCSPVLILSYRFIQKKMKCENSNLLYQYNARQIFPHCDLKLWIYSKNER